MASSASLPSVRGNMADDTCTDVTTFPTISPDEQYGYVPTLWICSTFVALFSVTTGEHRLISFIPPRCNWFSPRLVIHLAEAFYFRPGFYWLIPTTALCGVGEIIGWSGRLWSSKNPFNGTAFLMQYVL